LVGLSKQNSGKPYSHYQIYYIQKKNYICKKVYTDINRICQSAYNCYQTKDSLLIIMLR